jgi:hypothetical protein
MMLKTQHIQAHDPFYRQEQRNHSLKRAFSSGLEENFDVAAFEQPKKQKQMEQQPEEPENEVLDSEFWGWLSNVDLSTLDDENALNLVNTLANNQPKGHKLTKRRSSNKGPTAMEIFLKYIEVKETGKNKTPEVDCSGLISKDCYDEWLITRRKVPVRPEETFRKAILQHITCTDGGSNPFPAHIEKPLLEMLRNYADVWPCFLEKTDKNGLPIKIGVKGLRAQGFHEKKSG